jgi:hypothetical protein
MAGACKDDPLGEFYQNLLATGMQPPMARLTLARKIAAIALKIWKNRSEAHRGAQGR